MLSQPMFVFIEFASVAINRLLWYDIDNEKRASISAEKGEWIWM